MKGQWNIREVEGLSKVVFILYCLAIYIYIVVVSTSAFVSPLDKYFFSLIPQTLLSIPLECFQ